MTGGIRRRDWTDGRRSGSAPSQDEASFDVFALGPNGASSSSSGRSDTDQHHVPSPAPPPAPIGSPSGGDPIQLAACDLPHRDGRRPCSAATGLFGILGQVVAASLDLRSAINSSAAELLRAAGDQASATSIGVRIDMTFQNRRTVHSQHQSLGGLVQSEDTWCFAAIRVAISSCSTKRSGTILEYPSSERGDQMTTSSFM